MDESDKNNSKDHECLETKNELREDNQTPKCDVKASETIPDESGCVDDTSVVNVKGAEESTLPKDSQVADEANLHYEDGVCIYTEPSSKCQFVWDEKKQEWIPRSNQSSFSDKDYEYDGQTYTYKDKETSVKYSWDADKSEWKTMIDKLENRKEESPKEKDGAEEVSDKEEDDGSDMGKKKPQEITKQDMTKGHYGYEDDTHTYTDPSDGSKYFWDKEKNAWFPKVDDDFLAQYQMNYGFVDQSENQSIQEEKKPESPTPQTTESLKRKAPQEPAWFEVGDETTKVYVSGLPLDITETEFVDVMQKCGLVMRDLDSGKMKIKIYLDPQTSLPKGDALCTFIKKESVELALNLLDGSDVRGHRITVERAKFTMKGAAYDPSLKPKKKRRKDKDKLKKIQEKLFDWRPDKMRGERSKHEKIIIVKNLFDPVMFNKDVKLILEYQQDLREECLKCGSVKKVIIYDRHPEGVAQINFKEVEAADACVQLLNGRWFGQRKITAETWDGKTKYKMTETDEQIKARLQKWEKFLESGEQVKEEEKKHAMENEINPEIKEESMEKSTDKEEGKQKIDSCENIENTDNIIVSNEFDKDSDGDTRSSVGSDYETDDEMKKL